MEFFPGGIIFVSAGQKIFFFTLSESIVFVKLQMAVMCLLNEKFHFLIFFFLMLVELLTWEGVKKNTKKTYIAV